MSRKILETGNIVCLPCSDGIDGVIVDFEAERNEADPDCEVCESNPKENPEGKWCTSCKDDFKESDNG